jgi:hypothetical protein
MFIISNNLINIFMKKLVLGGVVAVVIAATIAFNVSLNANGNNLSDVSLANVEALADPEIIVGHICYDYPGWYCYWEFYGEGSIMFDVRPI